MKLQENRFYRTRDGRIAGPLTDRGGNSHCWEGHLEGIDGVQHWTDDGHFLPSGKQHNLDLVDRLHKAVDKAIDQMTLEDYRRGIAKLYGPAKAED
ncbi:hypothetical protein [Methylobacterium durans]|uniref:Uncharacterized protein n=1 Tax=Methylobacterium durans TaxID=2202825 RepID=A0A2U8WEN2_9HYPH|nr:hypothetical protein [Methylobacterium durans]AWN43796.1 hypothetical protein DK389_28860 [Methylobacterium durans]